MFLKYPRSSRPAFSSSSSPALENKEDFRNEILKDFFLCDFSSFVGVGEELWLRMWLPAPASLEEEGESLSDLKLRKLCFLKRNILLSVFSDHYLRLAPISSFINPGLL